MSNAHINRARLSPNDEFYTPYENVRKELDLHASDFNGAWVYCPCDTPDSEFVHYFTDNFKKLGLRRLTATSLEGTYLDYDGSDTTIAIIADGYDFRCDKAKEIMKQCDIVVTNPPFSLYKDFMAQLDELECRYWSMCNPYTPHTISRFVTGKATYGQFIENVTYKNGKTVMTCWQTNTGYKRTPKPFTATAKYDPAVHQRFDSCSECINCDKQRLIPADWEGIMGVPVSFIRNIDLSVYKVEGIIAGTASEATFPGVMPWPRIKGRKTYVNGVEKFARLIIRKRSEPSHK